MIAISDLKKSFGKTDAVDGLSLDVPEGQVTAFLGPNGAGKSTTIKCLLNLHRPDSGRIEILGSDSRELGPKEFSQIGYVSENMELPLWMTVKQFLDYCRPLYPDWDPTFEKQLLKQFDLPLSSKLKNLSRGMCMKAALLSSLAYRPRVVILDEPFSGLDPLVRDEFIRGLLELTEEEGWTVFISSHDIEEVQRLADNITIINRGQLALDESRESLQSRFRNVEAILGEGEKPPAKLPPDWLHAEMAGRTLRFTSSRFENEDKLIAGIREEIPSASAPQIHPMSLREIFVALARAYRLDGEEKS